MSLAIEKLLAPATGRAAQPIGEETDQKLNIAVVFTSVAVRSGGPPPKNCWLATCGRPATK